MEELGIRKDRIGWIDCVKGLAILLIVAGHCGIGIIAEGMVAKFIYGFHVPISFIISGYLYNDKKNNCMSPWDYIKK